MWFFPCNLNLATLPVLIGSSCYKQIPQIGWLKQQKFIFSQFWRLNVQDHVPAWWGSGENSGSLINPGLQCPHMVERKTEKERGWGEEGKEGGRERAQAREHSTLLSPLIRMLILLDLSPTFMTSFNLNYFLTPNIVTLGVRALTCEFGRNTYIPSMTFYSWFPQIHVLTCKIFILSQQPQKS